MPPRGTVKIELEVLGEVQVRRRLLRFAERAGSARAAFVEISDYLNEVEKEAFRTEGASQGTPWAPLAESTKKYKERNNLRPEILRATDKLFKALTQKANTNKKRIITPSTLIQGVKGFDPAYPEILMKKPSADGGRPRKPVDLTAANKIACVKILQRWIVTGSTRLA